MLAVVAAWAAVRHVLASDQPRVSNGVPASQRDREVLDTSSGGRQHAPLHAAQEKGRGREAATPTEIPAKGWKDIAWRVYE